MFLLCLFYLFFPCNEFSLSITLNSLPSVCKLELIYFYQYILFLLYAQGAPSYVRLFRHPNFDSPASVLANKSFFKADRVKLLWNKKGKYNVKNVCNNDNNWQFKFDKLGCFFRCPCLYVALHTWTYKKCILCAQTNASSLPEVKTWSHSQFEFIIRIIYYWEHLSGRRCL